MRSSAAKRPACSPPWPPLAERGHQRRSALLKTDDGGEPEAYDKEGAVAVRPATARDLAQRMLEMEQSDRAGEFIPWETFRAERGM